MQNDCEVAVAEHLILLREFIPVRNLGCARSKRQSLSQLVCAGNIAKCVFLAHLQIFVVWLCHNTANLCRKIHLQLFALL